jgi:hypothetical protein
MQTTSNLPTVQHNRKSLVRPPEQEDIPDLLIELVRRFEALMEAFTTQQHRRGFYERINTLLRQTEEAMADLDPIQTAIFITYFRDQLHPYFLQASAIARSFSKPLGYAGDYEMMNMAYRNQAEGESPLGRALHQWFNTSLGANAVRTRRRWILEQMQMHGIDWHGPFKIASIASGPAYELRDLISESFLVESCELTCVDQDPAALECASQQLGEVMKASERFCPTTFVHDSVRHMVGNPSEARLKPQSFIYSLGLYDYLPERVARPLTTYLYSRLEPGGRLIIGNYSPDNDARFAMELIMEWKLIYRTEAQLMGLASDLPTGAKCQFTSECTGMQLFLVIDKPKSH